MVRVRRQFVDGSFGQIHVRIAKPDHANHRPLVCLHMSPKSGRIFANFLACAGNDRIVIAHDYPGYGESDPPPHSPPVTIEDYATSLWEVVDALQLGTIDMLGYHTGSEVAAEAARQRPKQTGNIVMVSAPVFTAQELEQLEATFAEIPLDIEGTRFRKMWDSIIAHRGPGATLEMMAMSFAENLRSGEAYECGHRAAFEYAPKFPEVVKGLPHRITVFNPNDDLVQCTPRIRPYLINGEIIDKPEWGHGFFDAYTAAAAAAVKSALAPISR